jgi:hypothetical protein
MARKDLPAPSSPNFAIRVREEIHVLMGKLGSARDRALTLADAIESGVIVPGPGGGLVPGPGAGGTYEPDRTRPPQPGAFTATPAISHILIGQAQPFYTQGHGHLRTRVYGAQWTAGPLPVFADAVEVGAFDGVIWGMPSNPATTWHLWIKWESVDGVLSATPAGGTNGVVATTGQDVSRLLTALTGEIKESQLFSSLSSRINLIDGPTSLTGSVSARIATETTARQNADSANAAFIQQVQARLDTGDYAAVKVQSSTTASKVTGLEAQYTIKIDVNGFVSGYGLATTTINGVPVSDFQIRADRFSITNPAVALITVSTLTRTTTTATLTTSTAHGLVVGDTFTLRGVSNDTNWNGSYTVLTRPSTTQITFTVVSTLTTPATGTMRVGKTAIPFIVDGGVVCMSTAMIKDATITNAKIANLAVDDAKIANLSVSKLTAGSIAVGQYIQSTGYVAGSAGWRINGDGTAEFSGVVVRGTVFATAGLIGGITIASDAMRSGQNAFNSGSGFYLGGDGRFSLGNPSGSRLTWDGANLAISSPGLILDGGNATFNGGGTFSGSLSGATGTFAGSLLAGTVDVSQLIGQLLTYTTPGAYSVTVPAGFTRMRVTCVGAGGGGGATGIYEGSGYSENGGGGGGSGGFSLATFDVTPGATINLSVGAGGAGSTSTIYTNSLSTQTAGSGAQGGQSVVTGFLYANGGSGGGGGRLPFTGGGFGGNGGAGSTASGNAGETGTVNGYPGTYNSSGGDGGPPRYGNYGRGGNGGSATTQSAYRSPQAGQAGSPGFIQIEFFNPNGVIIRSDWDVLQAALIRQNIQVV